MTAESGINLASLRAWMDENGLGEPATAVTARDVSAGAQNRIFDVRRGDDFRAALRIPPPNAPAGRDAGIAREWRIIEALDGTGVPHPRGFAMCADTEVLGRAFYLTSFVNGWAPKPGGPWPEPFESDLEVRAGLAFAMVDGIAVLSEVDWRARGLEDLGRPEGFHERQVSRWTEFFEQNKGREIPGRKEATDWLARNRPRDYHPGLMHGDFQFANVMFGEGAPARLAAIVDWEMGTVGDPKLDLAWMLHSWPEQPDATSSYVDMTGMPGRTQLLDRYVEVSGRQVDDIDYYVILAKWKMAIVLEQSFQRAGDNPVFRQLGTMVLEQMALAAELASTTDYGC
jgi:aminoglycoside phosphotransferase (APT) family kinase protein